MALSQPFACDRIQVLAELQEIVPLNGISQTEPFRSKSLPPTKRLIVLAVVFADAQMLVKIGFRVDQICLCLPRKHGRSVAQSCTQVVQKPEQLHRRMVGPFRSERGLIPPTLGMVKKWPQEIGLDELS